MLKALTDEDLRELIAVGESETIEYKQMYAIGSKDIQIEFIRDMLALVNAHGSEPRYLVIGVDDKTGELHDVTPHNYDEARFQQILNERVAPPIHYTFEQREVDGAKIILITIPPSSDRFHVVSKQLQSAPDKPRLEEGEIWVRRGTTKKRVTAWDMLRMRESVKQNQPHPQVLAMFEDGSSTNESVIKVVRDNTVPLVWFETVRLAIPIFICNNGNGIAREILLEIELDDMLEPGYLNGPVGELVKFNTIRSNNGKSLVRLWVDLVIHRDIMPAGSISIKPPMPSNINEKLQVEIPWRLLVGNDVTQSTGMFHLTVGFQM